MTAIAATPSNISISAGIRASMAVVVLLSVAVTASGRGEPVSAVALTVNGSNHVFVSYNVCIKQACSVIDRTIITIIGLPISYLHGSASKNESTEL